MPERLEDQRDLIAESISALSGGHARFHDAFVVPLTNGDRICIMNVYGARRRAYDRSRKPDATGEVEKDYIYKFLPYTTTEGVDLPKIHGSCYRSDDPHGDGYRHEYNEQ